jgi:hypothetical protein
MDEELKPKLWFDKKYSVYCHYCSKLILRAPYYKLELMGYTIAPSYCCKRHNILDKLKKAGENG